MQDKYSYYNVTIWTFRHIYSNNYTGASLCLWLRSKGSSMSVIWSRRLSRWSLWTFDVSKDLLFFQLMWTQWAIGLSKWRAVACTQHLYSIPGMWVRESFELPMYKLDKHIHCLAYIPSFKNGGVLFHSRAYALHCNKFKQAMKCTSVSTAECMSSTEMKNTKLRIEIYSI